MAPAKRSRKPAAKSSRKPPAKSSAKGRSRKTATKRTRNYSAEYAARKARAERAGLSTAAARGHARKGELTAAQSRQARRHPDKVSIELLRKATTARALWILRDSPKLDTGRLAATLAGCDRRVLAQMMNSSAEYWRDQASNQIGGNPWFYH